nr:probable WRKY transcription factor 65 isoform X1 [Ipomoea batatas]
MDGRFSNQPPFINDQDDSENSPENSADSPRSGMFHDTKMASINSPKRSRRAIQKRVVSVPINDVEGSKLKGESSFPPSDSWAWRKYGQKPIKGSPYPSEFSAQPETETSEKFGGLGDSPSVIYSDEFGWFSSFEPTTSSSTVIESTSILTEARVTHADMSVIFSMREEEEGEESPFAGLGELPECSREFGIGMMERDEARRRHNLTPWCGTA